jgi:RHS repeat-associated protein
MRILLALAAAVFPAAVFAAGTTAIGPCPPGFVEAPQSAGRPATITEGRTGGNVACMPAPPLRVAEPLIQPTPYPLPTPEPMPADARELRLVSLNPRSPTELAQETSTRVILRTYDDFDRVETELVPLEDGGSAQIRYTYWRNGVRKTMQDAFGRVTFYEYDGKNRLSRVTANQGLPDEHVTTYTYWPDDLLKTITAPNGTLTSYDYDLADRVTSIAITRESVPLLSFAYTYDRNGNRLSQTETNGGAPELTTYTYDQRDRLVTVTYPSGVSVEYVYDAVSNRTGEIERDPLGTIVSHKVAVFDAINRLTSVTDSVAPANDATFTYDANGNLRTKTTAAGTETYDYDPRDLMVEARKGTEIVARYAYDAFGRRYLKVSSEGAFLSVVRQYLYDQTSLLHELDDSDLEVAKYEYGGDRLASLVRRDEPRRYYHQDSLGSVVALSDAGGAVVARYHLDAWGRYRAPSELDASASRFGFTGYLFDQETELYYAKARFYDPEYGRFTSQDSVMGEINEPPSLHRYFYGYANPLRYVDPTGHCNADASVQNFQDCFTAAITGVVGPPGGFALNWGSALLFNATGSNRFQARAETFQIQKEAVDNSLRSPAHLVTALGEGFVDQLNGFSQAINEGRGNDAAQILGGGLAQAPALANASAALKLPPTGALVTADGTVLQAAGTAARTSRSNVPAGILLSGNAAEGAVVKEGADGEAATPTPPSEPRGPERLSSGVANNIKGAVFENVSESASRRSGQFPFYRTNRRGGMDLALLEDGSVILREAKFANKLQYDDFSAITTNLRTNMAEIQAELSKAEGLTRDQRRMIDQTLGGALAGEIPDNLRIQVQTGKSPVGPRLKTRIRENTGGIPVEFEELRPR